MAQAVYVTFSAIDTTSIIGLSDAWKANLGEGVVLTNSAALALGPDFRPVIGTTVGVDAGEPMDGDASAEDLGGGQRVYNGRRDIGAFEADWRGTYARDIRSSGRIAVAAAGPMVVESAEKTVRIPSGQELVAGVAASAKPPSHLLRVRVTGAGTLTVTRGGETVGAFTSADGVAELPVAWPASGGELAFAYSESDGYAEILGADSLTGFQLRFR